MKSKPTGSRAQDRRSWRLTHLALAALAVGLALWLDLPMMVKGILLGSATFALVSVFLLPKPLQPPPGSAGPSRKRSGRR